MENIIIKDLGEYIPGKFNSVSLNKLISNKMLEFLKNSNQNYKLKFFIIKLLILLHYTTTLLIINNSKLLLWKEFLILCIITLYKLALICA